MSTRGQHRNSLRFAALVVGLLFLVNAASVHAQEWEIVTEIPHARTGSAAVQLDGHIYVIGGRSNRERATATVLRYDPVSNRWSNDVAKLPAPRLNATAVVVGRKILVIGGRDAEGNVLRKVHAYNRDANEWQEFPELRREREGASAVILAGSVLVIGGSDNNERALETVEIFNATDQRWDDVAWGLDRARVSSATVVLNQRVYIFGGFNVFGPVSQLQIYDANLQTSRFIEMPDARGGLSAVPVDRSIYLIGGRGKDGILNGVLVYRTESSTWSEGVPMNVPRFNFSAVEVDKTIYVFGGIGQENHALASVEKLGPIRIATEDPELPPDFMMGSTFPNPFSSKTTIRYSVSASSAESARLDVFDLMGRTVRSLAAGIRPGPLEMVWDGRDDAGHPVASGVYLFRLTQGRHVLVRKAVLLR